MVLKKIEVENKKEEKEYLMCAENLFYVETYQRNEAIRNENSTSKRDWLDDDPQMVRCRKEEDKEQDL